MNFQLADIDLIVGLGNIGKNYSQTRHNAGFLFLDYLHEHYGVGTAWQEKAKLQAEVAEIEISGKRLLLAKPQTMMNLSGAAVAKLLGYFKLPPAALLLAYDDLDLGFNNYKLQFNKGPHVHNGLNSVSRSTGDAKFWHLRLGIEAREKIGNGQVPGMSFALQRFTQHEQKQLPVIFEEICHTYFVSTKRSEDVSNTGTDTSTNS
jgi:PTH1 family peptidyl-tRNA hydrolase